MRRWLRGVALVLLLGLLALGPVVAGKLWVWQGLLVALVGGVALALGAGGGLLPEPARPVEPPSKKNRKPSPHPAAARHPSPGGRKDGGEEAVPPSPSGRGDGGEGIGGFPDSLDWALVAFLAWQGLSWFVSIYHFATSLYLAKLASYAIVFWVCRYGLCRVGQASGLTGQAGRLPYAASGDTTSGAPGAGPTRAWPAALWALVGSGGLLSVIGLREYVRTVHFLGDASWRVFGPMVNPNVAAGYLLLTIFPALALLLGSHRGNESDSERPRYPEIAAGFAFVLMFATLLLTGSKAGLAALLAGSVVFAIVGLSGRPKAQAVVLVLTLAAVGLALLLPPIRVRLLSAFGAQSHSTMFRLYTWEATLQMIRARPWLGFGGGTFEHILPRFAIAGFTRSAHQSFLQIAAETGVPGLLLGLVWGGMVLRRLLAWAGGRLQRGPSGAGAGQPLVKFVAAGALAALMASALQELADYPWYVPAVGYAFFALAGMALAPGTSRGVSAQQTGAPRPEAPGARGRRPADGGTPRAWWYGALVLSLLLSVWSAKNLIAEAIAARGQAEAAIMAYLSASATYERAGRWNPAQARFAVMLSQIEEAMAGSGDPGALARAVQARRRAIALQPTEPLNYLALARLYEQAGRLPDALAAAQTALAHYPRYPRGLAELAQLQEQAGQHDAALRTYRHLLDLQDSPVGRYPAVEGPGETAFAWGRLGLGDEAWRQGRAQEALADYSHAAHILRLSIEWERGSQEMAGSDIGLAGHLAENTQMAEEVLARLRRSNTALSAMRQAQLLLAMRRLDEAREVLERLAARRMSVGDEVDRLAVNWGRLRLAQEWRKDDPGRALQLALQADPTAAPSHSEAVAQGGWLPEDTAELKSLQQWAHELSRVPQDRPDAPP